MTRLLVAAAFLVACAERVPLSEVPVRGGTAQQHAEVRHVVELFEEAAGRGRVRLTEVVFERVYGALGRFDPVADRIKIADDLEGHVLAQVMMHELCHALDYTEDLMGAPEQAFDALVHELFGMGAIDTDGAGGPRLRRSEAFARYCELGPVMAAALTSPCPEDRLEVTAAARYLSRRVWKHQPPSHPPLGAAHAAWAAPTPDPAAFGALGLLDPSRIRVLYGTSPTDRTTHTLDIDDGRLLDDTGPIYAAREALPEWISDLCPMDSSFPSHAGWSDGPAAALFRFSVRGKSAEVRVLATDGSGWAPLDDTCVPHDHADLFTTADGGLWLAWVEDDTVRWTPVLQ